MVEPRRRPARATRDRPAPIQPDVPALEPERVPDADTIAFREAHRAHFEAHDEAAALAGWDRYLSSHPQGRYRLEARYNRALALVRSGRHREAREALASFARGEHRGYRQEEAAALVEALDARLEGQPPSSLDGQR
ncbi:MAG: hypothetical protein IT378_22660 [Sandaracinaceae bacterium]|nr:hypothetical protein [Sandaracinaceae bacterium]